MAYSVPYRIFLFFLSSYGVCILTSIAVCMLYLNYKDYQKEAAEARKRLEKEKKTKTVAAAADVAEKTSEDAAVVSSKRRAFFDSGEVKIIRTTRGPLRITVYRSGDVMGRHFLTYHDVGLDHKTCFPTLMNELLNRSPTGMCVYHVDAPGHSLDTDADRLNEAYQYPSISELAEQVEEALGALKKDPGPLIFLGVGAGSRVLMELARKYPDRPRGMILLSPTYSAAGWVERSAAWLVERFCDTLARAGVLETLVLARHLSPKSLNDTKGVAESVRSVVRTLPASTIAKYWASFARRRELDRFDLAQMSEARVMLVTGLNVARMCFGPSYFYDFLELRKYMDPTTTTTVRLETSGNLASEEVPTVLAEHVERFLSAFA